MELNTRQKELLKGLIDKKLFSLNESLIYFNELIRLCEKDMNNKDGLLLAQHTHNLGEMLIKKGQFIADIENLKTINL